MTPAVEIRALTTGYSAGRPVIENVSLVVPANDFLALIGPNGGGKTTLVKVILGLLRPWSGSVTVLGDTPSRAARRVGYVPQMVPGHSFPVTALDVALMGRLGSTPPFHRYTSVDRAAALENLAFLGVAALARKPMDSLSGGQRQRVLIARALGTQPELLLLDEPVASVDQETQESFFNLLSKLNSSLAIVLVTHDVGAVSAHVKSIACINRHLVSHGSTLPPGAVTEAYGCPFELVAHGIPHRVVGHDSGHEDG
jgi:zinc transport system ATP-binding protein